MDINAGLKEGRGSLERRGLIERGLNGAFTVYCILISIVNPLKLKSILLNKMSPEICKNGKFLCKKPLIAVIGGYVPVTSSFNVI